MKYVEEYNCFIDDDCVIYAYGKNGKLYQPKVDLSASGYPRVRIKGKTVLVHRVVALAFIPNPDHKPWIDHINRDRTLYAPSNLRWCTPSENQLNSDHSDKCFDTYGVHQCEDDASYQRAKYKVLKHRYKTYNRAAYLKHREQRLEYARKYREAHK